MKINTATTSFGRSIRGPELILEKAVLQNLHNLFPLMQGNIWVASSMPLGAGAPDILLVKFKATLRTKPALMKETSEVLAYLRAVQVVAIEQISIDLGISNDRLKSILSDLKKARAIRIARGKANLSKHWMTILQEIIAVEVKVNKWKRAIEQANRNRVFATNSFVALPAPLADNASVRDTAKKFGVGIISIDIEGKSALKLKPKRNIPLVWSYYFALAVQITRKDRRTSNGFRYFPRGRTKRIP